MKKVNSAWSYQALVHDLLNMGLNRVTVDVYKKSEEKKEKMKEKEVLNIAHLVK